MKRYTTLETTATVALFQARTLLSVPLVSQIRAARVLFSLFVSVVLLSPRSALGSRSPKYNLLLTVQSKRIITKMHGAKLSQAILPKGISYNITDVTIPFRRYD